MFAEDLAPFFSVDEFATQAIIGGEPVRVIFEQPFAEAFGGSVETTQPQCWAPSASVATVRQGAIVVIDSNTYKVERIEPDGTGISRIFMYPKA